MKKLILLVLLSLSMTNFAGPGGGHAHSHKAVSPIAKKEINKVARKQIGKLIQSEKINASWENSSFDKSEKKKFKGKVEWVVTFINKEGVKGQKLYIFLRPSGKFIAANFTGK